MSSRDQQRPPSGSSCGTTNTTRLTSNSVVLSQLQEQLDAQESTIKHIAQQQSAYSRTITKSKDTYTRHETEIATLKAQVQNLMQQQTMLMMLLNPAALSTTNSTLSSQHHDVSVVIAQANTGDNDKQNQTQDQYQYQQQQQQLKSPTTTTTATTTPTSSNPFGPSSRELDLLNKLHEKEEQLALAQQKNIEQTQQISILLRANAQKSQETAQLELEKLELKHQLQQLQTEHSLLLDKFSAISQPDKTKIVHVYDSVEAQIDAASKQNINDLKNDILKKNYTIQLIIKTLSGKATLITVNATDLVRVVKIKIAEELHVPLHNQILILEKTGETLENDKSLLELNILNLSTISLIINDRAK